ncbi:hypothetical protein [Conexibacter sp. DBS9H8]|uniref:hypothetical protein n=1 Tax=Conexibacter sp. DBS9H8 TaxID=2937801 RepID=UPI00200EC078|nr:hypothetical protein [Conexibacter sp. DBS9H8]
MAKWEFLTVAEELLGPATAVAEFYDGLGYAVVPEPRELGYPFAPSLRCKRQSTTCFIEVSADAALDRLSEWVSFGRSAKADTRVLLVLPDNVSLSGKSQTALKALGVGLLVVSAGAVTEVMPPQDLAVNVELPDLAKDPKRLRTVLGPVYEHFERNQWREGFEEACVALESCARTYLWKAVGSGRTHVLTETGKVKKLTKPKVDKMTMGALAIDFTNMQNQNHSDSVIAATLKQLNKDRIRVAHKKRSAAAERALRANVGSQMWRIVGALREIYK